MKKKKGRISLSEAELRGDSQGLRPFLELVQAAGAAVEELAWLLGRAGVQALLETASRQPSGGGFGGLKADLPSEGRKREGGARRGAAKSRPDAEGAGERIRQALAQFQQRSRPKAAAAPQAAAAGEAPPRRPPGEESAFKRLQERRLDEPDLLVLCLAGVQLRGQELIAAAGVDPQGRRHMLGVQPGCSAHAAGVRNFLQGLLRRGLPAERPRLFVVDASAALVQGVQEAFGAGRFVQRCRMCEPQRVCLRLPKKLAAEVRSEMGQACRLPCRKAEALLKQRAEWLRLRHPGAAQSLKEGLEQFLTVSRLGLPSCLRRCLGTTRALRRALREVKPARRKPLPAGLAAARAALLLLEAQGRSRRIPGWRDLWMLEASLQEARPPRPDPLESARNH